MKKTPLRYIFLMAFSLVMFVAGASIVARVLVNMAFVDKYKKDQYDMKLEEKLLFLNFPESYVPYYNLGNASYKDLRYSEAVGYYKEALKMYPPDKKECSIRINLALAMCNTIDFTDLSSQEKIDTAIFILYQARDVLLENGWAVNEGDDYRDADAQKLKEDIDKMIEKLENPESSGQEPQNDQNSSGQDNNESSGNEGKNNAKEKRQQDELQKNKDGAMKERQQEQQEAEEERKSRENRGGSGGSGSQNGMDGSDGSMGENSGQQNIKRW